MLTTSLKFSVYDNITEHKVLSIWIYERRLTKPGVAIMLAVYPLSASRSNEGLKALEDRTMLDKVDYRVEMIIKK